MAVNISAPAYNTGLNNYTGALPGYLVVDTTVLITLAQADPSGTLLDTLFNTGRQVVLTRTVLGELTLGSQVQQTVSNWMSANIKSIDIVSSPGDPTAPTADGGEHSITQIRTPIVAF